MAEAEQQKTTETKTTTLLDAVLKKGFRAKSDVQKTEAIKDIEALVSEVIKGVKFGSKKIDKSLQERIDAIDEKLSAQLAAIMHHEDFQQLEGSWRGLSYLVQNSDRLVTKDELIEHIWPERYISDAAISSRVMAARKALGDTGRDQRYIRTVHGRGFRFIGKVQQAASAPVVQGAGAVAAPAPAAGLEGRELPKVTPGAK